MQRPQSAHDTRNGTAIVALTGVIFATSFVGTAFALRSFTPLTVAMWRGTGGALALLALMALRRRESFRAIRRLPRQSIGHLVILGVLAGPVFGVGMSAAVAATGATVTAFVAGLYAVLAAVLSTVILREPLNRLAATGFVLALLGTALLADLQVGAGSIAGIGFGLGAAVAYALFLVFSRRWGPRGPLPGDVVSLAVMLAGALVLAPAALLLEPARILPASSDPLAVASLAWLAVGPSALANLLIQAGVRLIPARRVSALLLINPLTATLLAAVLLGERPTLGQALGGVLVVAGIASATGVFGSGRSARRKSAPTA